MTRVRRIHFRHTSTRPAARARRPLTHLVTITEALAMFDAGIDIGEHRGEQETDYDRGYFDGAKAMMRRFMDEERGLGGEGL